MNTSLKDSQNFQSSNSKKLLVPPTPQTQRLGYGTGVGVYTMNRVAGNSNTENLSPWALKKIEKKFKKNKQFSDRLKVETEILKSLSHPNIIGFRGEGKTKDGRLCLAMEKCGQSLGDILEERNENNLGPFPVENILKVAESLALALNYLHQEKCLIHGDIKSFNVLVKDDFEQVKLCDFGTPIHIDAHGVAVDDNQEYIGTELWSAPEVLADEIITDKADIFAYGLTLWEMLSLTHPNLPPLEDSQSSYSSFNSFNDSQCSIVEVTATGTPVNNSSLSQSLCLGRKPEFPKNLGPEYNFIIEIIDLCTHEDIMDRPNAATLVKLIQDYKQKK